MFAVVEINDKQHLVQEGEIFTIDGLIDDKKATFNNILMLQNENNIEYGHPYLKNVSVEAEIIETGKREKDIVFKFKRKTGYKLTRGHRQNTTLLRVTKINTGSGSTKKTAANATIIADDIKEKKTTEKPKTTKKNAKVTKEG